MHLVVQFESQWVIGWQQCWLGVHSAPWAPHKAFRRMVLSG